ncbi:MAG: DNA starvation/stationary phase protection protein [Bryobacteraceae bacterium]|nr:DNA starvation/stationary phase protection protein [Bryobacteraceae bacterium]MDW8378677.1 DNA starvation/stationary phase protection protein [Bryobacterales bacterium]
MIVKQLQANIGLADAQREGVIGLLRSLLADEYVLYTKTRNFHWNVTGPRFHDLHKFFEDQYNFLDEKIDEIAERIRSLGGVAPGSLAEFLASARLVEHAGELSSADVMLERLLTDHETVIRHLREDLKRADEEFGDAGTSDFLTGLMEDHEKMAWMLRAMLS